MSALKMLRACDRCTRCLIYQSSLRTAASQANSSSDLPRITVPHKMYANIQKKRERARAQGIVKKPHFKSPLVVSCKRREFNHHRGQTYSDFGPQALASKGWKHRKSVGDHFTIMAHDKNPAMLQDEGRKTFDDLHLHPEVIQAVQELGFNAPTSIQKAAIPKILTGASTLCAAETGSGKTFAYLLPALDMLLQRSRHVREDPPVNSPSIILLMPSRELADQATRVAQSLQEHLNFTMYSVCGGRGTSGRIAWPVRRPMDLLIGTPGVLLTLIKVGQIKRSNLQQVILDEADTLLDDSFVGIVKAIFHRLKMPVADTQMPDMSMSGVKESSGRGFIGGTQFVLVSATMPRNLEDNIGAFVPVDALTKITTSGLHRLMPHVPQKFLRVLPSQKTEELVKLVKADSRKTMMVFCNKSSTCFYLGRILEENGVSHAMINGEMPERHRRGVFESFQDGKKDVLLATDVASRGLDTIHLQHVVNYDFPCFMSDYIHRAGRVGRVGSHYSGLVSSFISQKWEVDLLWQIEIAARKSANLHNVNANIKRKLLTEYSKRHGIPMDEL